MIEFLTTCTAAITGGMDAPERRLTGSFVIDPHRPAAERADVYGAGTAAADLTSAEESTSDASGEAAKEAAPDTAADAPPPPAQASVSNEIVSTRSEFTIAAGVGTMPTYLGSNDRRLQPGIGFRGKVSGFAFSSRGTNLSVDLFRDRKGSNTDFSIGPFVNYRLDRTRGIGDAQVAALGKVKGGMEVGGSMGIRQKHVLLPGYDTLAFRVRVLKEVGRGHGSHMISPTIEYGAALSKSVFVGITATADLVGKGYGRHYYNVTPAGSLASGLPVYTAAGAKSGLLKTGFNLAAAKSLSGDLRGSGWTLVALAGTSKLRGRYAASPIVALAGRASQKVAGIALAYTF